MKNQHLIKFIQDELKDLDVPVFSHAYKLVLSNAVEAIGVLNKKELKKYIEEYLESLPEHFFH